MNVGVISTRYAKAMLAYSMEHGAEDAIYANMLQLMYTLHEIRELPTVLQDPMLSVEDRVALICDAVEDPSPVFVALARLVVSEEREELLIFIAHAFVSLYRKEKGILSVELTTATPIDNELEQKFKEMLSDGYSTVELENIVDKSIIGGFVCEVASRRLDASVAGQIRDIRKHLVKQNRKLV